MDPTKPKWHATWFGEAVLSSSSLSSTQLAAAVDGITIEPTKEEDTLVRAEGMLIHVCVTRGRRWRGTGLSVKSFLELIFR